MDYQYNAFISYRHCEVDQFVAGNLHKKLEKFKLPKASKTMLPAGSKGKIERVFRDEEELPLATDLSKPIEKALTNSDFLIVICTPRLAASRWCQKEIETFMGMHGRSHILLVLAEGEPEESFPELMTYEEVETLDDNGNKVIERRSIEPLAADVRGANNKQRLKAMDIAVIKLAAAMFGLNYDDVKLRHREQKLKRRIRIWSSIAAAVAFFACVCLFLLAKINSQNIELQDKYASSQAMAAEELLGAGRREDALYATISVLPKHGDYNAEAYRVLNEAMKLYSTGESLIPTKIYKVDTAVSQYCVSKDGSYVAILAGGEISVFDSTNGELICTVKCDGIYSGLSLFAFDGNKGLIYCNVGEMRYFDLKSGEDTLIEKSAGAAIRGQESDIVVVLTYDRLYGYRNGECIWTEDISNIGEDILRMWNSDFGYSADNSVLTIAANNSGGQTYFLSFETETGKILASFEDSFSAEVRVTSDTFMIYAITNIRSQGVSYLYLLNARTGENYGSVWIPVSEVCDVDMIDENLFIRAKNNTVLLDIYDFSQTGIAEGCNIPVDSFTDDGEPYVVDARGHIYFLRGEAQYGWDISFDKFDILPGESVVGARFAEGKYFYQFSNSDYIALYEENPDSMAKRITIEEVFKDKRFSEAKNASSEIDMIKDVQKQNVRYAVLSDDESKILLAMSDRSIRIYDKKRYKLLKVLYDMTNVPITSFVYLKEEKIYIVTAGHYSYILDDDLNYIAETNTIVGYKEGNFYINDNERYYEVPYVSYSSTLNLGKEIIGDYEPEDRVVKKYNMTE